MSIPTQLTVVNGCLATMGESPLNELEPNHPYVQVALLALDRSLNIELATGWWFNQDEVQLVPDAFSGFTTVPDDTLDLTTPWTQLVQRGSRLYDRLNSTYDLRTFVSTAGVAFIEGVLTRAVPFDDLPTMAKHLIALRTQLDFQASYDGDSQRYRQIGDEYKAVRTNMKAQNIRNSAVNIMRAPGVAEKMNRIAPYATVAGGLKRISRNG